MHRNNNIIVFSSLCLFSPDSSDNEDGDESDDDTANGFGTSLEPQAKKVRK